MNTKEFKSFYKTVKGGEGTRCNYPTRLDLYGCGCQHDCSYCYAKSLLHFRNLWNPDIPSVADIEKVKSKVKRIPENVIVRLGGMTDCFQPIEKTVRNTYNTIKELNKLNKHYLIVTKSSLIADEEYIDIIDKKLAHIQISVTSTDDEITKTYEKASLISERIKAIEKLNSLGYDVTLRLSPFMPELVDFDVLNKIKCDKILIEFLRLNTWIIKWFTTINIDDYFLKEGGYRHLPLENKIKYISKIKGNFKEFTVCEDYNQHYEYWKENYNFNKNDCCNLRV
jgi:DNA repair photolyase